MNSFYDFMFWASIFFVVLGGVLGLAGIWIKDFWNDDYGLKLILTDFVLAGTFLIVAGMTRWLGL